MRVAISSGIAQAMRNAAATAWPREACGLLFGTDDAVLDWQQTDNVASTPETHFEIDPAALFAALRAERAGGAALIGYWHSHPNGVATPSATDAAMATDERLWLIVGGGEITAWRMGKDGFGAVGLVEA
jgi:proteasome lid subunit RPN8/RPN11